MKSAAVVVGCLLATAYCGPGRVKKTEAAENSGGVKIYALKYGESFYPAKLVNTTSHEKNVRLNWLAYLVEHAEGKRTLIDCGFSDPALLRRFAIQKFRAVADILADLKIMPETIDTIILTHTHFDHALDVDKFPKARVILHARELAEPQEAALKPILARLNMQGRIQTVDKTIALAGLQIEPVMGHTPGSLAVRLTIKEREIIFTGDECYFAASCRAQIPLPAGAVFDAAANRRFIAMLSPQVTILTGHETDLKGGRWLSAYGFLFF